ncbi:MAG TPA: hypothetical protein VIU87_19275, partial [Mycobacterium sp.]
ERWGYGVLVSHNGHDFETVETVAGPKKATEEWHKVVGRNPYFLTREKYALSMPNETPTRDDRLHQAGQANWHEVGGQEYYDALRFNGLRRVATSYMHNIGYVPTARYLESTGSGPGRIGDEARGLPLPTDRILRNGNINLEIAKDAQDLWGNQFDSNVRRLMARIDVLMGQNPIHDKTLTVRVSDIEANIRLKKAQARGETSNALAWALLSDHAIIMRATHPFNGTDVMQTTEALSYKNGRPWHPIDTVGKDSAWSTMDHEWGHLTDITDDNAKGRNIWYQNKLDADPNATDVPDFLPFNGELTLVRTDGGGVEWYDYDTLYNIGKELDPETSHYGTTSKWEMRAEAHAAWMASQGTTSNPMAKFFFGTDDDRRSAISVWFKAQDEKDQAGESGPLELVYMRVRELEKAGVKPEEARWRAFRETFGFYNRSIRHSGFYSSTVGLATDSDFSVRWEGVPMPATSVTTINTNVPSMTPPEPPLPPPLPGEIVPGVPAPAAAPAGGVAP